MLTRHHLQRARVQLDSPELAELLRAALPLALDRALDDLQPEGGGWLLLRQVPAVQLSLDPEADLHEAVARLQAALRPALRAVRADPAQALLAVDAATLRAESWVDAVCGRWDRAWAWQRLQLWPAATEPQALPRAALIHHLLALLDRDLPTLPDAAPPPQRRRLLLRTLLSRGLLARWLALADASQWARLSQGLPGAGALAGLVADTLAAEPSEPLKARPGPAQAGPPGATAAAVLAAWSRTPLNAAARPAAALHLAWLAWLLGEPLALQGAQAAARLQGLARALLAAAPTGRATPRPGPPPQAADERSAAGERMADPGLHWPSAHAGLLHLLAALPSLLTGELAPERLLRLAHHGLRIPLDDAVIAVLLGRPEPAARPPAPEPAPWHTAADRMALDHWLSDRLQRHLPPERLRELPFDTLGWLIRREARLQIEPGGWCARFPEADPLLRRCGLDRDPDHLPWLGLSVRLHYGGDQP